jgi:hypothetical protein
MINNRFFSIRSSPLSMGRFLLTSLSWQVVALAAGPKWCQGAGQDR